MSATQVFEFETSQQENRFGELVGVKIRIELGGDGLVITGTSTGAYEGRSYEGTLTLRRPFSTTEGGDECWINGRWVSPCHSGAGEGDDGESAEAEGNTDEED